MILFEHVHETLSITTDVFLFLFLLFSSTKKCQTWALVWTIVSYQSGFVSELRICRYVCTTSRFGRDGNEWVPGSDGIALGSEIRNGTGVELWRGSRFGKYL